MIPDPNKKPLFSKVDYMRNAVHHVARAGFLMYLSEGGNLQQGAALVRQFQEAVHRAFVSASNDAVDGIVGPYPLPPGMGDELSDDNPFTDGDSDFPEADGPEYP
jgi:hypothetical protein